MMILSTGQVVACENDVHGLYPVGKIGRESISEIWRKGFASCARSMRPGDTAFPSANPARLASAVVRCANRFAQRTLREHALQQI